MTPAAVVIVPAVVSVAAVVLFEVAGRVWARWQR